MRLKFLLIFIFLSAFLFSQNWNVFNKNYRYNYKFNYSTLVSNVLFVDTVKYSGMDTIYCLNRIGVECTGTCPTITTALNPTVTYVVPNMPQFLQRKIRKYSTGLVMLLDTSKQVIIPTCSVTQTWRFDSILNLNATCTAASSLILFGQNDSLKTIIVNGIDTILLSKNFGIIQFPEPYNKNKYYRLVGIETKSLSAQTAIFGEKVPNAWEFYNFNVGDVFCDKDSRWATNTNPWSAWCTQRKIYITGKTISVSGYSYTVNSYSQFKDWGGWNSTPCLIFGGIPNYPFTFTTTTNVYNNTYLSTPTLMCNYVYPGMIVNNFMYPFKNNGYGPANIIKFGNDNYGRFYKYMGRPCSGSINIAFPNFNAYRALFIDGSTYSVMPQNSFENVSWEAGEGFGVMNKIYDYFEESNQYCLYSAVKSGTLFFGPLNPVGVDEHSQNQNLNSIYPNPANNTIQIPALEDSEIKILNTLGKLVYFSKSNPINNQIDVSQFPVGIYFVNIESPSFKVSKKLIIQH